MKKITLLTAVVAASVGLAAQAAAPRSGAWTQQAGPSWESSAGAIDITVTPSVYSATSNGATFHTFSTGTIGCQDSAFSDNGISNTQRSLQMFYNYDASETLTINFSEYVTNPVLHLDRLGGAGANNLSTSTSLTVTTPGVTMVRLAGIGAHFDVTGNTVTRAVTQNNGDRGECGDPSNSTAAGSVQLMGTFNSVTLQAGLTGSISGFRDLFELSFTDVNAAEFDYGDAPNSYGNAGHLITSSPALRLGSTAPDADTPDNGNNAASRDDTTGVDDEDGIQSPNFAIGTPYNVTTNVTTSGVGYLNAWVDWNRDGDFDTNERISLEDQAVTTGAVNLTGIVPASASTGRSYVRVRICSTQGECNTPTGLAFDGEAEDRRRLIQADPRSSDISVTKTDISNSYTPGTNVEYTLTVTNNGPSSVSGININDVLPDGMTLRDGGSGAGWVCTVTTAGLGSLPTACPVSNGPTSGSLVDLDVDMANDAVITVTVYAQYSADPSVY